MADEITLLVMVLTQKPEDAQEETCDCGSGGG
jgi:hypothetical protein